MLAKCLGRQCLPSHALWSLVSCSFPTSLAILCTAGAGMARGKKRAARVLLLLLLLGGLGYYIDKDLQRKADALLNWLRP
jgi:hypothetical protein